MECDPRGRLHIIYSRNSETYYQSFTGEGACVVPEELVAGGTGTSLAVTSAGEPHVLTVCSGVVVHAARTGGLWTNTPIRAGDAASLCFMNDEAAYLAYSAREYDGDTYHEVVLAVMATGSVYDLGMLLDGSLSTYTCAGRAANEHHDYVNPVLRCADGVIHVAARHQRDRDASYKPGGVFCPQTHDERIEYIRIEYPLTQIASSEWSYYHHVFLRDSCLCMTTGASACLVFTAGPAAYLSPCSIPWSETSLGFRQVSAVDFSSDGLLGTFADDTPSWFQVMTNGARDHLYEIGATSPGWNMDVCMEHMALLFVDDQDAVSNEVFLILRLDRDEDGLDDRWEYHFFGSPTNGLPGKDSDEDSFTDAEEQAAGTDPTNGMSFFRLEAFAPSDLPSCVLSWQGRTGRSYTLQGSADLPAPSETLAEVSLIQDDRVFITNAPPESATRRLYWLTVDRP